MAITRTAIVDDDGSGTTGTVLDNAWKQELYNQIDAVVGAGQYVASAATGTVNDWNPGSLTGSAVVQWSGTADLLVGGLVALSAGAVVRFVNVGTGVMRFYHLNTGSSATCRLFNAVTSAPTRVASGGWITYAYNGSNWVLADYEQGSWLAEAYSAGDYSAPAGTWTVDAGDVTALASRLSGKTLQVTFTLVATSVSSTPGYLIRVVPGGYAIPAQGATPAFLVSDNGTAQAGYVNLPAGTAMQFYKVSLAAWSTSTNGTILTGTVQMQVT